MAVYSFSVSGSLPCPCGILPREFHYLKPERLTDMALSKKIIVGGAYEYLSESFLLATSKVVTDTATGLRTITVHHYLTRSDFTF